MESIPREGHPDTRRYRGVSTVRPIDAAKEAVPVIDLADLLCGPGGLRRVGKEWAGRCPLPDHEEIERTGPSTYRVPSCSGTDSYMVDVRAGFCLCPDHRRAKALGEACKHRTAAEIAHAKRHAHAL